MTSLSSDSEPGWSPSGADRDEAVALAAHYFAALDAGRYADAYAMQADALDANLPEPAFEAAERLFNAKAGPLVGRRLTRISWTKHPDGTSNPGIFAAVDMVERFANVDRACGYLVLVHPTDGGNLKVLRVQVGSLDNEVARDIEAKHSAAAVDQAWRAIARQYPGCPTQVK